MKKDDIYVYIGDYMEHPDVFDTSFINSKEATKYEKYRILFVKDELYYCYITTIEPFSFGNEGKVRTISFNKLDYYFETLQDHRRKIIQDLI